MKIFISYSHKDSQIAETLYNALKAWGHEIWIDIQGIPLGAYWTREIDKALEWADVTVGIMTENSIKSENVLNEWHWTIVYGEELHKRLILLKADKCFVPHYYVRINWIPLDRIGQEAAYKLLQANLEKPIENIARITTIASSDPYRDYLQALYQELEDELDFLVLSVERMMDISAQNSPDKVQEAKRAEKPRMLQAFSRRTAQNESPIDSFKTGFDAYEGRLLLLGEAGAGKTITILTHARDAVLARLQDPKQPLPLLGRIATWNASKQTPLHEWLAEYLILSSETIQKEIETGNCLLLLDGLDELGNSRVEKNELGQEISYDPRKRFIIQLPVYNKIVLSCRIVDYKDLGEKIRLNGAIRLQVLSDEQIRDYLQSTEATNLLWEAIQKQPDLLDVLRNPLLLSLFAFSFRDLPENIRKIKDLSKGKLRDGIFEAYVTKRYEHEATQFHLRHEEMPVKLDELFRILGRGAMINASERWRYQSFFEGDFADLQVTENVFILEDFDNIVSSDNWVNAPKIDNLQDLIDISIKMRLLIKQGNYYQFAHILFRDFFAIKFCIKRLRNNIFYPLDILPTHTQFASPAQALGTLSLRYKEFIPKLIRLLTNKDKSIQRHAIQGLSKAKSKKAVEGLSKLLTDTDPFVRADAVAALGEIQPDSIVDVLLPFSQDLHPSVRISAIYAIAKTNDERKYAVIENCILNDPVPHVRRHTILSLMLIEIDRFRLVYPLTTALQDADDEVRFISLTVITNLRLFEASPYIAQLLNDKTMNKYIKKTIGQIALESLINFNTPKALEAVRKWKAENNITN